MQDGHVQHIPNGPSAPRNPSPPPPSLKCPVTVVAIPSVAIENGRLLVGTSQSSSTRSYTPIKVLGNGSFGTVWLCDWHGTLPPGTPLSPMQCGASARPQYAGKRLVAVKRMKKRWEGGWDECQKLKELESLRAIPFHHNIIPLYDFFLLPDTKELYFVFESMEGNLYHLIKTRKGRPLAGGLVSSIFQQITLGLVHIHSHGYFHRDMKPENVLVTTTGLHDYISVSPVAPPNAPREKDVIAIIKLADFGLARETKSAPPYTEYVSTRWYRAPEVLLFSRDYSNPVDMWAFGTIMAELVNLRPLFPGAQQLDQIARICDMLGDPSDAYGFDLNGIQIGGGPWEKGIALADSVGYRFPKSEPKDFYSFFDKSVPRSLVNCIRALLRYDPDKRLTSKQCLEHPYLQETTPRNNIPFPSGLEVYSSNPSLPRPTPYANGSHSNPSLVSAPHAIPNSHSHSAHNLHHPQQFPDASISHRIPYPIPAPRPQFLPPPTNINAHNDFRQHHQDAWSDSQADDYPMDIAPPHSPSHHVNGHAVDAYDSPMVQDPPRPPEPTPQDVANAHPQNNKSGKLGALSSAFVKKPSIWRLGFGGDKSHHHNALPPVDETSPAVIFPTRKRAQSSSTDSRSLRENSPVRVAPALDTRDAKKLEQQNKREAERVNHLAEVEKRKLADKTYRERAREVMHKRHRLLQGTHDEIEWNSDQVQRIDMAKNGGKQPSYGPVRRERDQNNAANAATSVSAAAGRFVAPNEPMLSPDREWRGPSERITKVRRREFDDDHSMSSSDVHSMSRMSSMSFVTVDSDPGPSQLRNRPSLYNMSRRTSRSSLRTSFDDFPPSARSSNSFSLEGQLAHDFRTRASVTSHLSGSISPPPLQLLSLSPTMSPSLSPSPPWIHLQQQKEDLLSRTQSPPYISISPGFPPNNPLDPNSQLPPLPPSSYGHPPSSYGHPMSSYGYPPSSGHTPKSAKSAINPIFKVVSYKWDRDHGLVPDDSTQPPLPPPPLPIPPSTGDRQPSPNILPPFSQLEAAAGGGELPPLSPMIFTTPEDT